MQHKPISHLLMIGSVILHHHSMWQDRAWSDSCTVIINDYPWLLFSRCFFVYNPLGSFQSWHYTTPCSNVFLIKRKTPWRIRGGLAPETLPGCADSDNHVQLGAVLPTFDREVRGPGGATRGCINDWMQKRHPMQMFDLKNQSCKFEVFGVILVICFHLHSPCICITNLNWPNHNNNVNLSMMTSAGRSKLSGTTRARPAMKVKTMSVTNPRLRTAWAENLGMNALLDGLAGSFCQTFDCISFDLSPTWLLCWVAWPDHFATGLLASFHLSPTCSHMIALLDGLAGSFCQRFFCISFHLSPTCLSHDCFAGWLGRIILQKICFHFFHLSPTWVLCWMAWPDRMTTEHPQNLQQNQVQEPHKYRTFTSNATQIYL